MHYLVSFQVTKMAYTILESLKEGDSDLMYITVPYNNLYILKKSSGTVFTTPHFLQNWAQIANEFHYTTQGGPARDKYSSFLVQFASNEENEAL